MKMDPESMPLDLKDGMEALGAFVVIILYLAAVAAAIFLWMTWIFPLLMWEIKS